MSLTLRLALFVLCLVQSGVAYTPTIVTGLTIPKCKQVNRLYSSALHAFVNGVRSDIGKGIGAAIINMTSEHVTKERHMDGLTYSCYYERIASGLLSETGEHQRRGLSVNYYQLIYTTASYMGCALRDVQVEGHSDLYDFKVVCVFVDHRPKHTRFLVEPSGTPCKGDTDCSTDRTCKYELCFAPVMDVVYQ